MQLTADAILSPDDALKEIMNARNRYLSKLTSPFFQGGGADKRWKVYVPDPSMSHGRRLICRQTREDLENAVILYFMQQEQQSTVTSSMTVGDCWQLWYDFKRTHNRTLKTTTLQLFRSDKKKFFDGTAFAKREISTVRETDIEDYLVEQVERYHLTQTCTCRLAGYIRGVFFVAYRQRIIDSDPWDRVSLKEVVYPTCYSPQCKPDEERILSDIQIRRIRQAVETHLNINPQYLPDYGILIALHTGMRVGELAALEWSDIQNGCIQVTKSLHRVITEDGQTVEIGDTKNHKHRAIPIGQELTAVLDRIRAAQQSMDIESTYILDNGALPTANSICKAAKRRGIEAGIEGPLTIHRIRRTVASRLNAVYDRATVSHIMGHTEEVDAKHYDYDTVQLADKQAAMDRLYA